MKRIVASAAIALSFNFLAPPAKANPVLLAPVAGICGTGIGCVLIGTVIIGGIVYYVYSHSGRKVYVRKSDRAPSHYQMRGDGMTGVEAAALGNSHWVNGNEEDCEQMGKRNGWELNRARPAKGGGFWCIFKGKQTDFSEGR